MRSIGPSIVERLDHVVLDEGELRVALQVGDVLRLAGDEVIDADHLVALRQEQVGQVRAEETRRRRKSEFA